MFMRYLFTFLFLCSEQVHQEIQENKSKGIEELVSADSKGALFPSHANTARHSQRSQV